MDGLEHRTPTTGQPSWPSGAPALEGPGPRHHHRRLSPAGMRAALATSLAVLGLLAVHTLGVAGRLTAWVHARPLYVFKPESITLDPPPPPWIKSGVRGLNHQVGAALSRFDGHSTLDLELPAVTRAFKNLVWVERVERVERSFPNELAVRLDFRRPVAFLEMKPGPGSPTRPDVRYYFDKSATLLPEDDLDVRALPQVVQIAGIASPADSNPGAAWVEYVEGQPLAPSTGPDARPEAAIRLAAFLLRKFESEDWPTDSHGRAWPMLSISLKDQPADRLFLVSNDNCWMLWGAAPGKEPLGELTAEEKWRVLVDLVSRPIPRESGMRPFTDLTESRASVSWRMVIDPRPPVSQAERPGGSAGSVSR